VDYSLLLGVQFPRSDFEVEDIIEHSAHCSAETEDGIAATCEMCRPFEAKMLEAKQPLEAEQPLSPLRPPTGTATELGTATTHQKQHHIRLHMGIIDILQSFNNLKSMEVTKNSFKLPVVSKDKKKETRFSMYIFIYILEGIRVPSKSNEDHRIYTPSKSKSPADKGHRRSERSSGNFRSVLSDSYRSYSHAFQAQKFSIVSPGTYKIRFVKFLTTIVLREQKDMEMQQRGA
jgi:hypothetical protein